MKIGVLGGGIAGLAVAWYLRGQAEVELHEASDAVGGLARSFKWHGFDCDLAPHRFYTDDAALLREVQALIPLRRLRRRSRIRLRGRWIGDPVNVVELLAKFLPAESARMVWQYVRRPHGPEDNFEALVLNKYGRGLNDLFFKPYSEKLFGIPAREISATWGRRKIRVSGLRDLVRRDPRLYFRHFYYPVSNGYGAIADALYARIRSLVRLGSRVDSLTRLQTGGYQCGFSTSDGPKTRTYDALVSTLPKPELAALLGFSLRLRFRPLTLLYLLIGLPQVSDCHWCYFADRHTVVNRAAEFKHFGKGLPERTTVICCEVTDEERFSIDRVVDDLSRTGFLPPRAPILDTRTIRLPRAYPLYDRAYDEEMAVADRAFSAHPDLYQVGRHAQFAHRDVDQILADARHVADSLIRPAAHASPAAHAHG